MPRPKRVVPKPCLHKPSGRARVYVNGEYIYLGKWGSPEAEEEYRRLILDMATVPSAMREIAVNDLVARFLVWAEQHYRHQNGEHTGTFQKYRYAVRELIRLHGQTPVLQFGPLALKDVREKMVNHGLCRGTVNEWIVQIRTMFKWGVENELVPETIYRALLCVRGLEQGKTTAPDHPPIQSVPDADVIKTLKYCHKTLADMIRVQKLAGMRPQEVRLMRSYDLLKNDPDIWVYVPHRHKTQHKKKYRTIPILPECQQILIPYLIDKEQQPEAYLFSPADAMKMIAIEKREKRKSKVQPSQQMRKKGTSRYNDHYTKDSYLNAIERACDRAGVPRWSPNRLRHSRATEVNNELGIEAARILLGHSHAETTKIYLDSEALLKEQIALTIENAKRMNRGGE